MTKKYDEWEAAWAEYVEALDWLDHVPCGENFVIDCGNAGRRLDDAKWRLRGLDRDFCERLGI